MSAVTCSAVVSCLELVAYVAVAMVGGSHTSTFLPPTLCAPPPPPRSAPIPASFGPFCPHQPTRRRRPGPVQELVTVRSVLFRPSCGKQCFFPRQTSPETLLARLLARERGAGPRAPSGLLPSAPAPGRRGSFCKAPAGPGIARQWPPAPRGLPPRGPPVRSRSQTG